MYVYRLCLYPLGFSRIPCKWRSPEEYDNRPLNEKIDIWSLGNNMYSILTGCEYWMSPIHVVGSPSLYVCSVFPFYEAKDVAVVKSLVQRGETGFIDPRFFNKSIPEARLAEIIQLCWEYNIDARPDIFQLRNMLRRHVGEYHETEATRSSPLLISHSNATFQSRLRR